MTAAIRRAAGVPETARRWPKGVKMDEVLRTHNWQLGAGLRLDGHTLEELDPPAAVLQWIEDWNEGRTNKGLLITGPAGVGKTTLMSAVLDRVLRTAPRERLRWSRESIPTNPVFMVAYPQYVAALQRMMSLEGRGTFDDEYDRLEKMVLRVQAEHGEPHRHAYLCCLDDVGREYQTRSGWTGNVLNDLLRQREYNGMTTCATANHPLETWDVIGYDAPTISFAHQTFVEVELFGKDRRK